MLTNFKAWIPLCALLSAGIVFSFEVTPAMHAGGQTEPEAGERKNYHRVALNTYIQNAPGTDGGALTLTTWINLSL